MSCPPQAVQSAEQRERQAAAARAVALLEAKAAKLCEMLSSVIEDTKVGRGGGAGVFWCWAAGQQSKQLGRAPCRPGRAAREVQAASRR